MTQHLPSIPKKNQTLVDILRWRAEHQPNQRAYTFLVDGEEDEVHLSYAELDKQARAIAAGLQQRGMAGERALLLYPPGLDFIVAFFGCLYAGVVAVPSYPPRRKRPSPRLQAIVRDAQPAVVLSESTIRAEVIRYPKPALMGLEWLVTNHVGHDLAEKQAALWQMPTLSSESLAFLQYTSGSTATPKGVMLTHGNLLHNLATLEQILQTTSTSRSVIWLPSYHDMGLIGGILEPLYGGFPIVLMSPTAFLQKPLRWLQAISHYRATSSSAPNFAYDLCVEKITPRERETLDLSSWEVAFNGAEPVRAETLERFVKAFEPVGFRRETFYPCYGLAEGTLIVSGGLKGATPILYQVDETALLENKVVESAEGITLVGCGQSKLGQEIVIVQPETGRRCAEGEIGEIWVKGASVAMGYWKQPEKTEATFAAYLCEASAPTPSPSPNTRGGEQQEAISTEECHIPSRFDSPPPVLGEGLGVGAGPFLRTGDLGFLKRGELFVTGRIKDLIIIRGRNHYPQDIELTAQESHVALQPHCGAAFSVEIERQERLVIVFELKRRHRKADVEEVADAIRAAVAQRHELEVYAVLLIRPARIPKTTSGKIQRYLCRKGFLEGTLPVIGTSIHEVTPETTKACPDKGRVGTTSKMPFSLFFFSANEAEFAQAKYKLLIEAAKFADQHEFNAVWLPERHFHAFGGLYPNPSTLAAALAMVTERVRLRAGSVVLPLHHPIRVAEEWSVVDNLSNGRVDLSFATGWNPNDFMLAPERYQERVELTYSGIDTVQTLWAGETVGFPNGAGDVGEARLYPLPQQKALSVWLTCSGGSQRFVDAGRLGYNVLTALLFQSVEQLAEKLALYRKTRRTHGHDDGHVTLMLHTYIGSNEEQVRDKVRPALTDYLKQSVNLWRQEAKPLDELSADEQQAVLNYAFERYYQNSGLFGTPESALTMVQRLKAIGVDEIACLIDFGVDSETVLAQLPALNELRIRANAQKPAHQPAIKRIKPPHRQTHEQTLPHWIRQQLAEQIANVVGISPEQVPFDKSFHGLGIDSIKAVQLMADFGNTFDISLPATLLFEFPTLNDLTAYLLEVYRVELRAYMRGIPSADGGSRTQAHPVEAFLGTNQKPVTSADANVVDHEQLASLSEEEIAALLASELG